MSKDKVTVGGFDWALGELQEGKQLVRRQWGNDGRQDKYIQIQRPDENSKMTCSYIYTNPAEGLLIPWSAGQDDIMGEDWEINAK